MTPAADPSRDRLIDRVMPEWQWREFHARRIDAPPEAVWRAIHETPTDALRVTRPLMWLRTAGRNAPARGQPVIATMPPRQIATNPPQELLLGLVFSTSEWWASATPPTSIETLDAMRLPGGVRVVVNMLVEPAPDGSTRLSTETRAMANDAGARRRFGLYWVMIRAGSGLIRRDILGAIARTAEAKAAIAA